MRIIKSSKERKCYCCSVDIPRNNFRFVERKRHYCLDKCGIKRKYKLRGE